MQWRVHDSFSLERQSAHRTYTMTDASHLDYQWRMVNNPWLCIDTYCHEGVRSVSLFSFPINQANTLIFYRINHIAFDLPDLQDQKLLTLHWNSISEWGRECEARSFADEASQYRSYEWSQPIAKQITTDARPNIIDTMFTLILPWVYPQYIIMYFGVIYHWSCFGSLCTVFIYFLLHQNIVL